MLSSYSIRDQRSTLLLTLCMIIADYPLPLTLHSERHIPKHTLTTISLNLENKKGQALGTPCQRIKTVSLSLLASDAESLSHGQPHEMHIR